MNTQRPPWRSERRWLLAIIGIVCPAMGYWLWNWNPLPSDESMIENFQAHRADFVEAVRRYREYPRPPSMASGFWYKEGDTLEVYKRAGIDDIDTSASMWLPNPYSVEAAIERDRIVDAPGPAPFHLYNALDIRPATTPRIDHPDQMDDSSFRKNTLRFGVIWKDYFHVPQVPRVENGELLLPLQTVGKDFPGATFYEREGLATIQFRERVLPTLNRFPDHWNTFIFRCVYRQIEPQWFLRMCKSRR